MGSISKIKCVFSRFLKMVDSSGELLDPSGERLAGSGTWKRSRHFSQRPNTELTNDEHCRLERENPKLHLSGASPIL